jgi:aerobic-type carbon monoxide dehydrogenase small subunit (CoxS/CutS family)
LKAEIFFTLNGQRMSLEVDATQTLLDLLRNRLGMTSVKNGCNSGDCGVCTVLIDGKAVRSCLILAPIVDGKSVETVEAIGRPGRLHPLQETFLELGATQCGYCTPGMILTAKAFLDEHPDPRWEEIVQAISGNLCRCTGYAKIIEAIELAAERMKGGDVGK